MADPTGLSGVTRPGMGPPRLVATDLDGTLVRSDGTVSARSAAALAAVSAAGIQTVVVTARPPRWLHDVEDVLGPHGIAVCGNGAFVYDVVGRRLLRQEGFDPTVLQAIVRDLRQSVPGVVCAAERGVGAWVEPDFPDRHGDAQANEAIRRPLDELDDEPVGKLLALAPQVATDELLTLVERIVGDRGVLAYSGAGGLAEVNPPGVTKAAGLARWCTDRDVMASDVWAFGDMPNDLPMLQWAGVGVAVANAHVEVLAHADLVCPSNDDDGVAVVLESLL